MVYYRSWMKKNGVKSGGWYWKFQIRGVLSYGPAIHPDNPKQKARTKAEAKVFEAIAYQRVVQGIPIFDKPKELLTFAEFVDRVYKPYALANLRSYGPVTGHLKILCAAFGDRIFSDISPFLLEKFKIEQGKRGISGNTIRLYLATGSAVFDRAIAEGTAKSNPFRHVATPEINPRPKRRLSRDEEDRLLKACLTPQNAEAEGRRDHLACAIILMLELGPRMIELFNLKMEDVTWDAAPGERLVRFISYKTGRRRVSHQPKERWVPVTDRAWEALLELRDEARGSRLYPYDSIKKVWGSVTREAGVSGFWFRWLRSEAASRWAEAGMNPYEIAYLLGHTTIQMSQLYVVTNGKRLRELMSVDADRCNIVAKENLGHAT